MKTAAAITIAFVCAILGTAGLAATEVVSWVVPGVLGAAFCAYMALEA